MVGQIRADTQSSAPKTLPGVDVSSYQGLPSNWTKAAGNIDWAAVKFTELEPNGTHYVNPDAGADWDWLAKNKKGRIAYLFGHPSVSATATVNLFMSEVKKLGLHDNDGIALDLEVTDGLPPAKVNAWGAAVESALHKQTDRKPLLYTYIDFAKAGNCNSLGGYPLWIADPSSPAGQPRVPKPWKTWAIHQYDISGSIDRDVANYPSLSAMAAALGKQKPQEPPVRNLGGNVSAVSSARWTSGEIIVAGLAADGFVQTTRWANNAWSPWKNVSRTTAIGNPSLLAFGKGYGRLYYIDHTGAVIEMITRDTGLTWV